MRLKSGPHDGEGCDTMLLLVKGRSFDVRVAVFILALIFLCGCAKLAHLEELLTLKSLSDNQVEQAKYIEAQDKKFKALLEAVENNRLDQYPNQRSFLKAFGQPIFTKKVKKENQQLEQWLYRYGAKFEGSEKVYLYFDDSGNLVSWKHIKPDTKDKIVVNK